MPHSPTELPPADRPPRRLVLGSMASLPFLASCSTAPRAVAPEAAQEQVRAAETAFADTMARRDLAAFDRFVAADAVFINGGSPLRGRERILAHWSRFFQAPQAPFAWRPQLVEIAGDGRLGYTEGPVTAGDAVIARFYSTWQQQADGSWHVVFDNGIAECKR